ncbi:MAG TPA: hypothetical protein VM266_12875 [Solirubrobacteraceae bacterium]|nr:hypothetical protein [Solirubrobacteraceae bacterium]
MRRLLAPLLLVLVLAGLAVPAGASANQGVMFSMMMDDDLLLYRGDDVRDDTLRRMKRMGVDYVRVSVLWSVVAEHAKRDRRGKRRRNFRPDNPRTYPRGNWDRYDRLVRAGKTLGVGIYFNVTGPGPSWAHAKAPKSQKRYRKTWKPNPREFFKFVKAVGLRYDGTYQDENDGRTVLPRVGMWSIYNEPNQQGWLTPQWQGGVPWSPVLYRELWYYGRAALDASNHTNDIVFIGETAPLGSTQRNSPSPVYPKRFIRELFCISPTGRRYTGASARKRKCEMLEKIEKFRYTAWAHHPYTKNLAPTKRDRHRDSITMANVNELSALLDIVSKTSGRGPEHSLVALTEFGYETNPPDRFSGIDPVLQAEFLNVGDYMAYKDPRVIANTQFLLRDVPGIKRYKRSSKKHWFTYQSGLFFANGRPKPAAQAYIFPLLATGKGTDSVGQEGVNLWGWIRFHPLIDPENPPEVYLQFRPNGAGDFSTIGDPVKVTSPLGFFEAVRAVPTGGTWRAVWIEPISKTAIYSREAEYSG